MSLEWLGKDDAVAGTARRDIDIEPGLNTIEVPLPIPQSTVWLRLRYSLAPDRADARAFSARAGIVALPYIAHHVFELKVSHAGTVRAGTRMTIYAQAIHPVTRATLGDARWRAGLRIGETSLRPVKLAAAEGIVELGFDIPAGSPDESAEVEVTATLGDFTGSATIDVRIPNRLSARLQTDKPIYQPGQILHLRGLVTDPAGNAKGGAQVKLKIEDQEDETIHSADLASSRFGVIQDEWTLPPTAGLGTYRITLTGKEDDNYILAQHMVQVSRYELPAFQITVKPDRTAYLPGQPVKVSIAASYLFGKPVPGGTVRITRSGTDEDDGEPAAEGKAEEDGTFAAELDVRADHRELADDEHARFRDLRFAAYYTDPGSGRTEQRRFDVRITRQPIHVYIFESPAGFYVSTQYADGRPAVTTVEMRHLGRTVTLTTNQYGVAKAVLPNDAQREDILEVRATDRNGQVGNWRERFWRARHEDVRIESSRTLHRSGEPVTLQMASGKRSADDLILVHAIAGDRSVATRVVRLAGGRAQVRFPFQPEFRRTVVFAAWNGARSGNSIASTAVIFPDASDLRVIATAARAVYRPGEKVTLRMQVQSMDGRPQEAALGLAVVDEAVLERARTESEFGRRPWFACAYCRDAGEVEIGGVRLNDLYLLKPGAAISPELDMLAEALVARDGAAIWTESSERLAEEPEFRSIKGQMKRIGELLDRHYKDTLEFPDNAGLLDGILGNLSSSLHDPWGMPYITEFGVVRENKVLRVISSGPDKRANTEDDFTAGTFNRPYFAPFRLLISEILKKHSDYPANDEEFRERLRNHGLLFDSLRDPWGQPYQTRIQTYRDTRHIAILSAGEDSRFGSMDDVVAARFSGHYFEKERAEISRALQAASEPQDIDEFVHILTAAGIAVSDYRDAWGNPYRLSSRTSSHYANRVDAKTVRVFGQPPGQRNQLVPVTQHMLTFALRSDGPDGKPGSLDDFDIAHFTTVLSEEAAASQPETVAPAAALLPGTGAITGMVTDASGAVVPRVTVVLTAGGMSREAVTAEDGIYWFPGIPSGIYTLRASHYGFKPYEVSRIPVAPDKTTTIDIELQVGNVSEQVTVMAEAVVLNTESAQVSAVAAGPSGTPRVREYFPDTLLWLPEILTDTRGAAEAQFTLADSVTTWKVAMIASTLDGRVAEIGTDIRAFQPFFLDFSPPPVLTDGDQLDLPVTVRNYQEREQKAVVSLQPNSWSSVKGPAVKQVVVAANSSANLSYAVQAKGASPSARQRITVSAGRERDAIEKPLRVHPDGQEVTQTAGDLIAGPTAFAISIPPAAIAWGSSGELRLYPGIASMLLESARSVLRSPHGCAEQNISAGYANLLALRYARSTGVSDPRIEKPALANVAAARDAVARFARSGGGVSYWNGGEADMAVTAYALSFLVEASAVVPVDVEVLRSLSDWLQKAQGREPLLVTALVLRSLAAASRVGVTVRPEIFAARYHHLAQLTDQTDAPYLLSHFILAALDSGDEGLLGDAASRLAAMARDERGGVYWDLRSNTPFHGWGTAGRFETTGAAVSALTAWRARHPEQPELDSLIRRGLVFLLRGRDPYGSWYSTQSTVRAMRAMADASAVLGNFGGRGGRIGIRANGHLVQSVAIPEGAGALDPVRIDVSPFLIAGSNRLELTPTAGTGAALALVSSSHWLPWHQTKVRSSGELRLSVGFDRLEGRPGEPVRCKVKAERVGFRGYGMMIAEIGLPPAAEVDRASLESVIEEIDGVDRYEILPDRVLFYLWPTAGGVSFDFTLRVRIPLAAKSTASVLYDYYNPEALSEVAPFRWVFYHQN